MTVVVGTAGHIDHGKTALLRALTGIDADRLPEERARGMTIDLGYAHLALDDGSEIDFVDVPGHDRLVGNMLVGAGEIDAALLVVAADDGPRAQTIEHLELLDALDVRVGVAVITKIDVVEPSRVERLREKVGQLLEPTSLRRAPIVAASALTGDGLEDLLVALRELRDRVLATAAPAGREAAPPTLAIDRVFTIRGRGTVVTGTLRGGPIAPGMHLLAVPGPAGASVRVREVQVHGRSVSEAGPGRVALNVAITDASIVLERGLVLTSDPWVRPSDRVLVALRRALPDRARATLHLGTTRVPATIGRAGRDGIRVAADEVSAIVRLERPIAAAPGDRFVLRRPSPAATLAGGRVLDPEPAHGVARRRQTADRLTALAAAPARSAAWLEARLSLHGISSDGGEIQVADDLAEIAREAAVEAVAERGRIASAELVRKLAGVLRRSTGPVAAADRAAAVIVDKLIADGTVERNGAEIRPPGAGDDVPGPALAAAMSRLEAALSVVAPPRLADAAREVGCPPDGIRRLERDGRIVRLEEDLAWGAAAYADLSSKALRLSSARPLTPAALRDETGTSRKYVMAILEDLDRRAILRRTPEGHVPGPRAGSIRVESRIG